MKNIIKGIITHTLAICGRHRWPAHKQLLILTYHRILPPDDHRYQFEQPGMMVHPDTFNEHLCTLKKHFTIVSLEEWLHCASSRAPLPKKACAITFDDGWRDNYEYAFPILKNHRVPATIFLVSDLVGTTHDFWPGRLAKIVEHAICYRTDFDWTRPEFSWLLSVAVNVNLSSSFFNREYIDTVITRAKSYPDKHISDQLDELYKLPSFSTIRDDRVLLNWDEVLEMRDSGLILFGSHTQHHTRLLEQLPEDDLLREISDSKCLIFERTGRPAGLFCYPNGDTCPLAINLVKGHYQGACTTIRGWNSPDSDHHLLKRISIHQDSAADKSAFLAKLSGWY